MVLLANAGFFAGSGGGAPVLYSTTGSPTIADGYTATSDSSYGASPQPVAVVGNVYTSVYFTGSGSITFTSVPAGRTVDILVFAGAGGGAETSSYGGGGGGGGGIQLQTGQTIQTNGAYTVTVGAGASGSSGGNAYNGSNSTVSQTSISTITANGGGGGSEWSAGQAGGCGGGGGSGAYGGGTGSQGGNGGRLLRRSGRWGRWRRDCG